MAIGSLTVDWLVRLHRRGFLPRNAAVLDLGPQDLSCRGAMIEWAARQLGQGPEMVDAIFANASWRYTTQPAFYRLFGARTYDALDLFDPRAAILHDLNKPFIPEPAAALPTFDIICDFGTTEHVFNIGQAFVTLHRLLAPGGLLLCAPPSYGYINHGFYNLHPMLFTEIAAANGYELVDYHYVDNWFVRCAERDQDVDRPFSFEDLPIQLADMRDATGFMAKVALQFQENLAAPATARLTDNRPALVFDLSLAALRKASASPQHFVYPHQSDYSGGKDAQQNDEPGAAAPAASRCDLPVFDQAAQQQNIMITRDAAPAPDGSLTAILLEDASPHYATMFEDFAVPDDTCMHCFSIDVKAGTSPLAQIVMAFIGGSPCIYHAFIDTVVMSIEGNGTICRKRLGDGWFRISLAGANNASGNKTLRLQVYPRHGRADDTGTLYVANARLNP
jgi:SAM-dependent methyltransferase